MSEPRLTSHAPRNDAASAELDRLRECIDAIDDAILEQLNERARLGQAVGALKRATQAPIYSAARERDLVARLAARNPGPFPTPALRAVFREIISAVRSLEGPLRVAYFGPEGTFTHLATRQQFGGQAELAPLPSIPEVIAAVERGAVDLGVVPVENTTEGVVTETFDTLVDATVTLCGEIQLRVALQLLSRSGRLEDVKRVASYPQPFAQCRGWLERTLPGVERVVTASTAAAARLATDDPAVAAIGSAAAAEAYGLEIAAAGIEDRRDNTTRFLVLGREPAPPSGCDLTSAVFTVGKHEAGALHRLLEPFAAEGVNLTAIQSRPIKGKPWEYLFFVDLEGHASEERVARALAEAARRAHSHRVLGSFPRASARSAERGAVR